MGIRVLVVAIVALVSAPAHATEFVGTLDKLVDGDTFWLCDEAKCSKIRLCGINTPERGTPGDPEAREALRELIVGKQVRCVQVGNGTPCDGLSRPTSGDRIVAQCFVGDQDVAQWLTSRDVACDWEKYSGGHYGDPDCK